jgi:hypothetical protein
MIEFQIFMTNIFIVKDFFPLHKNYFFVWESEGLSLYFCGYF